jgi:hypothetical protein
MVPGWLRDTRTRWPDFVVFVDVPKECSNPSQFCLEQVQSFPSPLLSCDKSAVLHSFSTQLLKSVRALMGTENRSEKLVFSWNLGLSTKVLYNFFEQRGEIKKGKIVFSHYFNPLSLLLGTDYHFVSEENYSSTGWGFNGTEFCNHFVDQVNLHFGKQHILECERWEAFW